MNRIEIKPSNVSITRIEEKCLNCGMCLKTCKNINNIGADCINCGQCILTCPSGALVPKFDYKKVLNYIHDTDYTVVGFVAPAVRVAIGDEFGFEPGTFLEGKLVSSLKAVGFDYVFDVSFGADMTIMEESLELVNRLESNKLPLYTSCCPSWVEYLKKYQAKYKDNLSTCKSPIAMQSALIKSYFAKMYDIPKEKIIAVCVAPCVSKKRERLIYPDTDIVITTRELAMMIRESNIDFKILNDSSFDKLMGESSKGGLIFGASGGVTESVLRTVYYMINKKEAPSEFFHLENIRGEKNIKTAVVDLDKYKLNLAVVNKISTIQSDPSILSKYDFIEVMACPGGCIGGAGQPLSAIKDMKIVRDARINGIYEGESKRTIKNTYQNKELQDAYISYISKNDVELHTKSSVNV